MALANTNKATEAMRRAVVRMSIASATRSGTLGVATRNARRTAAGIARRALREQDDFALGIALGLRDETRWER